MANRFLSWYDNELGALRKRAAQFAQKHPKIAGRLRMNAEAVDDPHVERMMQGFAYSAARIRQKLEDDFPELTDTLLEALYPQYLAQIPSMSIMKIQPIDDLGEPHMIGSGFAVDTEVVRGDSCRYKTTQPVVLTPLEIAACSLQKPPFAAPLATDLNARSCLSITFRLTNGSAAPGDLDVDALDIFIKAPFATAARLYEFIFNQALGIAVAEHGDDPKAVRLPLANLKPIGFDAASAMLPFPKRSFPGFRLLTEYFALPEKFLFFRLSGLKTAFGRMSGTQFQIFIYLNAPADRLAQSVDANSFDIHCTPVINLFSQHAEPIQIDQTHHEYDVVPDARNNSTREVHSIAQVHVSVQGGKRELVYPFFGRKPASTENKGTMFWLHKRNANDDNTAFTSKLCLVDLALNAATTDDHTVASVEVLCINRGLPEILPFGGGQPYLNPINKEDQASGYSMLLPPTATVRFDSEQGSYWRLISHLSLNHLPVTGDDPELLREMLRLYDFRQSREAGSLIDSITAVESKRSTARLADGSIAKGVDITITFDDSTVDRGLAYLFGMVLSHFLGLYASINTFSRLTIKLSGTVLPIVRFPPRTAGEVLL